MFFDIDRQIKNIGELEKFIIESYTELPCEQLEKITVKATDKNTNYSLKATTNMKIINELTDVVCMIGLPEQIALEWKKQTDFDWGSELSTAIEDFCYKEVTKELVISNNIYQIIITKNTKA